MSSDSFVNMEAGQSTPAQKTPVHHVGETLALIELASVLLIGVTSYTIGLDFDFEASVLNYSLAVGVVALLMCLVARFSGLADNRILALFSTVWWLVGTGVMTEVGPYNNACIGYFAAWLGLIGSLLWAFQGNKADDERRQAAAMLGLSSVVLIISIAYDFYGKYDHLDPSINYGLATAALSIFASMVLGLVTNLGARRDQIFSAILAFMWVSAAICMAWDHHGNALFATFAGTLFSVTNLTRAIYKPSE